MMTGQEIGYKELARRACQFYKNGKGCDETHHSIEPKNIDDATGKILRRWGSVTCCCCLKQLSPRTHVVEICVHSVPGVGELCNYIFKTPGEVTRERKVARDHDALLKERTAREEATRKEMESDSDSECDPDSAPSAL